MLGFLFFGQVWTERGMISHLSTLGASVAAGYLVLFHTSCKQVTPRLRALIDFLKTETKKRGVAPMAPPGASISRNYLLVGKESRTAAAARRRA
jgi:hypothetical protein